MFYNDCYWDIHDMPEKVYHDSMRAIDANKDHMTPEQVRTAVTQTMTGLAPDGYNQLCDRLATKSFQG